MSSIVCSVSFAPPGLRMTMFTNESMPSSARARSSGFEIEPSTYSTRSACCGRPDVQDPQLVMLGQVRRDERADHAGATDQEDLHDRAAAAGASARVATDVRAMITS